MPSAMRPTCADRIFAGAVLLSAFLFTVVSFASRARAQAPGVPIERGLSIAADQSVIQSIHALRAAGKLLDLAQVKALLKAPQPEKISLPAPAKRRLPARQVYRLARGAFLRLGWIFKVPGRDPWQMISANGYAIAEGGVVATAAHLFAPPEPSTEAYLFAVTADGQALPVVSILAVDNELDAAIVRVPGFKGAPLALSENVSPGDRVYCLSDPADERGYFATGTVNRFYWAGASDGDTRTLAGIKNLRMDVSVPWAPGSSGAAVLDAAGNAVGHVWMIWEVGYGSENEPAADGKRPAAPADKDAGAEGHHPGKGMESGGDSVFQIHTAIPARGIRMLAQAMESAASKPRTSAKMKQP